MRRYIVGPYLVMDGLVLIRLLLQNRANHPVIFRQEMEFLIRAYKERYLALMTGECVNIFPYFTIMDAAGAH